MGVEQNNYHFIGICGTAMGSLAASMADRGFRITGSDENVYPPMSTFLENKGIAIAEGFSPDNIPDDVDYVVIGNAMSRGNPEVEAALNRRLHYVSLPGVLREVFLRGKRNVVVTGTHGKTTTTSLTAWLLKSAGLSPSHMIGGIPKNLGQGARFTDSDYVVLEGDEYDTAFFDKRSKFVHYLPEVVIVNNIEFDHADIFSSIDEIKLSFRRMLNIVPSNGVVLVNGDDPNCLDVVESCPAPVVKIGLGAACDRLIGNIRIEDGCSLFQFEGDAYRIPMAGEFNVRNACMGIAAARFLGVETAALQTGLAAFEGVARRQEVRGEVRGIRVIDDFGHHPTAIAGTLDALRGSYPGRRIWAIFEPRSNTTRRKVFQDQLPAALGKADGVFVAAVASTGGLPEDDRLDVEAVVESIRQTGIPAHCEEDADAIVEALRPLAKEGDIAAVFSNGGFGNIHEKLLERL